MESLIKINSIDEYNKMMGFETKHPLVAVVDLRKADKTHFRRMYLTTTVSMPCFLNRLIAAI